MSLLNLLAFSMPVVLPFTTEQGVSIILRAIAEIGFIVSIFLAFKYSYGAFLTLVGSTSVIVSYTTVAVSDIDGSKEKILLASLWLSVTVFASFAIACHMRRKLPKRDSVQSLLRGDNFEFPAVRSFSEFISQNKSAKSLQCEKRIFENIVDEIQAR